MKNTINAKRFLALVVALGNAINRNNSLPILDNILIDDGRLIASNLETSAIGYCDRFTGLNCLVNYQELMKMLKRFGDSDVQITLHKNTKEVIKKVPRDGGGIEDRTYIEPDWRFEIGNEKKQFTVSAGETVNEFPNVPSTQRSVFHVKRDIADFDREIMKALPQFLGNDELRPVMMGVLFEKRGKIVATNAHILYFKDVPPVFDSDIITPGDLVKHFNKLQKEMTSGHWVLSTKLPSDDGPGSDYDYPGFQYTNKYGDELTFLYRSIDGKYPNYEAVIPQDNPIVAYYDKAEMLEIIDDALVCASKETKQLRISLNGQFKVTAEDVDFERQFTGICESGEHEGTDEFDIGFNGALLATTIKATTEGDTVRMELSAPNRAAVLNGCGLVMPVMLND
jgi:DNA polymerase-3 subunit beta